MFIYSSITYMNKCAHNHIGDLHMKSAWVRMWFCRCKGEVAYVDLELPAVYSELEGIEIALFKWQGRN